ncbi:zeta toxin family protein [Candidatus Aalborgicola defluviihabitans]|uniref:zeta toxin family protein n=1 Tax=Candidatus Aalborgicola defluviihabitans TaxID=3386187 RepID=UPI0039B8CD22
MFESAEIGHQIDKASYKAAVPALRAALLEAQINLHDNTKIPVVVLVSGQDGAGKGETINVLYEWMDPRFLTTLAFSSPTDEESERPPMWRYWRSLPPKGSHRYFCRLMVFRPDPQTNSGRVVTERA